MKLEDQVCSLELAQKLKELGVRQESLHLWLEASDGARLMNNPTSSVYKYFEKSAAFTVAELGEMLQKYDAKFDLVTHMMQMDIANTEQRYAVNIPQVNDWTAYISDTEANSRAKMLIYLIENNLITV